MTPTPADSSRPLPALLALRNSVNRAIRAFFEARDFVEVTTPIRIPVPALEDYIDAVPSGDGYLRTSPELQMKRCLATGVDRLYQLGPCFRAGEAGRRHLPEFTMLEWYRRGADHLDILADTVDLVRATATRVLGERPFPFRGDVVDVFTPWEERTVDDAFDALADRRVDDCLRDGSFEQVLVEAVEPHLGRGQPTVLMDYPTALSTLSLVHPDRPDRAQRWELYVGGIELVNACGEQTDPRIQRAAFEATQAQRRRQGREVYGVDEAFLACLEDGLPPCAGAALGVDRLVMILLDADHIAEVVPFAS